MINPPLAPHVDDPRLGRFLAELIDYLHRISYLSPAPPLNLEIGAAGAHLWIDLTTLPAGVTAPLLSVPGGLETPGGLVSTPIPAPVSVTAVPVSAGGASSYTYAITYLNAAGQETSLSLPVTMLGAVVLSASNGNLISWPVPAGVTQSNVYRLASSGSGAQTTTGLLATVPGSSYVDSGTQATTLPPATNMTCAAVANQYITTGGLTLPQIATAGQPTATATGTTGAITYTYGISVVTPTGETTLGTTGTTATGNATLTTTNNVSLTWAIPVGIPAALVPTLTYGIYRTASGGAPSTTGMIGVAGPFPAGTTPNFIDTGLPIIPGRPTTAPATNLANLLSAAGGLTGFNVVPLPTPPAPTVTTGGTSGATSYTYKIVAHDPSGTTPASSGTTIATGNATLSATNYNAITWPPLPGNPTSYDVYRTASGGTPSSTGLIGTVYAGNPLTLSDTGLTGDASSPPASNTTGRALIGGTPIVPGGITIGAAVSGGTAGRVLFEGAGPVLADSANLTFVSNVLTVTGNVTASTLHAGGALTLNAGDALNLGVSSSVCYILSYNGTTPGYIPLVLDGSSVTLSQSGTPVLVVGGGTVTVSNLTVTGNVSSVGFACSSVWATGNTAPATGQVVRMLVTGGSGYVQAYDFTGGALYPLILAGSALTLTVGSTSYIMPATDGSAGDSLQTDASGNLSWGPAVSTTGTNGQVAVTPAYTLTGSYANVTSATFTAPATGTYLIQAQVRAADSSAINSLINCKLRNTTTNTDLGQAGESEIAVAMTQVTVTVPLFAIAALTSGDVVYVQAKTNNAGSIPDVLLAYVRLA